MNNKLTIELLNHVIATLNEIKSYDPDFEVSEIHDKCFNEDHYIVGYYNAEKWLELHDISAFEVIADVIEWEQEMLGEVTLKPEDINAEKVVNLYVYIKGEELLSEYDLDQSIDDLLVDLKESYKEQLLLRKGS